MKLKDVLEKSIQFFKDKNIDSPRLSAELLIASALKLERMQLYLKYETPLSESETSACREFIKRHSQGEPVAYIVGTKGFFGEIFFVGPGVLIPRPETEGLVEEALSWIKNSGVKNLKILDLGAGTGCIGLSILAQILKSENFKLDFVHLTSVEKSTEAFRYLKENVKNLNLEKQVNLVQQDVLDFLKEDNNFDLVVANPPYIDVKDSRVEKHVRDYEPHAALFAEDEGLFCLKNWSLACTDRMNSPGIFLMEMGCDQGPAVRSYLQEKNRFKKIDIIKDLSGLDRIIKAIT